MGKVITHLTSHGTIIYISDSDRWYWPHYSEKSIENSHSTDNEHSPLRLVVVLAIMCVVSFKSAPILYVLNSAYWYCQYPSVRSKNNCTHFRHPISVFTVLQWHIYINVAKNTVNIVSLVSHVNPVSYKTSCIETVLSMLDVIPLTRYLPDEVELHKETAAPPSKIKNKKKTPLLRKMICIE